MFTRRFWIESLERAAKSAAQAVIGLYPLDKLDVLQADWRLALGVAGGGALLSLLMSVVSAPIGEPNDPSMVPRAGAHRAG